MLSPSSFSEGVDAVFETENLKFPPTADTLIDWVNSRVLNGENYKTVHPKIENNVATFDYDYEQYDEVYL